jgi:hypothetical protein
MEFRSYILDSNKKTNSVFINPASAGFIFLYQSLLESSSISSFPEYELKLIV